MKNPLISIIMPEYNTDPDNLTAAISSILNQTYRNIELIIVDDCSKNDLDAIVGEFDDNRIVLLSNSKNSGAAESRNKGILSSKGEYIALMDSDDISLTNRIETIYQFITLHPEYDVVGTRAIEFDDKTEYGIVSKTGEKTRKSIIRSEVIINGSVIIKGRVMRDTMYRREYIRAQDYVLWCDLLLKGKRLYVIEDILYKYRVSIDDYKKRGIRNRKYEIKARIVYYPKLGATAYDYVYIVKSIIAGLLPGKLVAIYRKKYVLSPKDNTGRNVL